MPDYHNRPEANTYFSVHKVQEVIDYIEAHLLDSLTLEQIAGEFYISSCILNQTFKLITGFNVIEYVRNRRLSLAAQELRDTRHSVIDIALSHCYETPEAFTKAFQRIYGFPPSVVRRTHPQLRVFSPIRIEIEQHGGWEPDLTNVNENRQDIASQSQYNETIQIKGGLSMSKNHSDYEIFSSKMRYGSDYKRLLVISKKLREQGLKFKVDGKTMIFAHGIEFPSEKICLTFSEQEKNQVQEFFTIQAGYQSEWKSPFEGFAYMDTEFDGFFVRCMYYHDNQNSDMEQFLYQNSDIVILDGEPIHVQSLEFYLENAKPDPLYYKLVTDYLDTHHESDESIF